MVIQTFKRTIVANAAPIWAVGSLILVLILAYQITLITRAVATRKHELAQTTIDLANLDSIIADTQKYEGALTSLRATLPGEYREIAASLSTIEQVAKSVSVILETRIDDTPKDEPGHVHSLLLTMRVSGTFSNIRSFLTRVAGLAYHTRVESFTLDNAGGTVAALIAMKLYIY